MVCVRRKCHAGDMQIAAQAVTCFPMVIFPRALCDTQTGHTFF